MIHTELLPIQGCGDNYVGEVFCDKICRYGYTLDFVPLDLTEFIKNDLQTAKNGRKSNSLYPKLHSIVEKDIDRQNKYIAHRTVYTRVNILAIIKRVIDLFNNGCLVCSRIERKTIQFVFLN